MTRPLINWHTRTTSGRTLGQRSADVLRNGMGKLALRVRVARLHGRVDGSAVNGCRVGPCSPASLLNLFLSMLAGLQGERDGGATP